VKGGAWGGVKGNAEFGMRNYVCAFGDEKCPAGAGRSRAKGYSVSLCQQLNQVIHRVRRVRLRRLGDRLNHQPVLERVRPKRRHHPIQLILRELLMQQHFTRQFRTLPH